MMRTPRPTRASNLARAALLCAAVFLLPPAPWALAQASAGNGVALASMEPQGPVDLIAAPFPRPAPPSTAVRVALLDASASLQRAGRVAVLLSQFRKRELEEHIGMKIEVANIAGIPERPALGNVVFYRPEFLRAAALLAKAIPGEQSVRVMPPERMAISGVDVEVVLATAAP